MERVEHLTLKDVLDVLNNAQADTELLQKLWDIVGPYNEGLHETKEAMEEVRNLLRKRFKFDDGA